MLTLLSFEVEIKYIFFKIYGIFFKDLNVKNFFFQDLWKLQHGTYMYHWSSGVIFNVL